MTIERRLAARLRLVGPFRTGQAPARRSERLSELRHQGRIDRPTAARRPAGPSEPMQPAARIRRRRASALPVGGGSLDALLRSRARATPGLPPNERAAGDPTAASAEALGKLWRAAFRYAGGTRRVDRRRADSRCNDPRQAYGRRTPSTARPAHARRAVCNGHDPRGSTAGQRAIAGNAEQGAWAAELLRYELMAMAEAIPRLPPQDRAAEHCILLSVNAFTEENAALRSHQPCFRGGGGGGGAGRGARARGGAGRPGSAAGATPAGRRPRVRGGPRRLRPSSQPPPACAVLLFIFMRKAVGMWSKARAVGNAQALSIVRAGAPQAHRPHVHRLPRPPGGSVAVERKRCRQAQTSPASARNAL